jgi:hypothetical protein
VKNQVEELIEFLYGKIIIFEKYFFPGGVISRDSNKMETIKNNGRVKIVNP